MRAVIPTPGNPWPHDMTISVANDSAQVTELLWVREAWGLHPVGDVVAEFDAMRKEQREAAFAS